MSEEMMSEREQLREALAKALAGSHGPGTIIDAVLAVLDQQGWVSREEHKGQMALMKSVYEEHIGNLTRALREAAHTGRQPRGQMGGSGHGSHSTKPGGWMNERPICEGCGRPMPLTDTESMALQRREFEEFEDVLYPNGRGRRKSTVAAPSEEPR